MQSSPGKPPANLMSEDLRLCFGDMNLSNFIMEDGEDPSSRLIIIGLENASSLQTSFFMYSYWFTYDAYISEGIKLGAHLEVNEDTIAGLDNPRRL